MSKDALSKRTMSKKEILEMGVNRLKRLLEIEQTLESFQQNKADFSEGSAVRIETGLTALKESGQPICPTIFKPYQSISPGVKVGYQDHDGAIWAVIDFESAENNPTDTNVLPIKYSKLSINPVFSSQLTTNWFTFEVDIYDFEKITELKSFDVSLTSDFTFKYFNDSFYTNTVKINLRGTKSDKSYEDMPIGFFPITTVPMSHTFFHDISDTYLDWLRSIQSLKMIIWLPTYGQYKFNIYDLIVEAR